MYTVTSKQLNDILTSTNFDLPVRVFCSFNQYEIKRASIHSGTIILEVGDANNPIDDYNSPIIA